MCADFQTLLTLFFAWFEWILKIGLVSYDNDFLTKYDSVNQFDLIYIDKAEIKKQNNREKLEEDEPPPKDFTEEDLLKLAEKRTYDQEGVFR